ncbi:hypothetical protein [Streptococcus moroccensis]|uniref:Phage protein n=1 Tax=Streptococcus moroccensis TaxID=1451356 RepID=A0ABT9YT69_9STRE|nr:hypothetical protein [Streptococcus moroccensis]MDQ0223179.1 hypothetical protein [Streptococcus moroccensis]
MKDNITYFEASVGGFHEPPIHVTVDFLRNTVTYINASEWELDTIILQSSKRKMSQFLNELKKCHLFDWDINYPNYLSIVDGSWWKCQYVIDGKTIVKSGENNFPDEWERFCIIVSKLTGKEFS